MGGFRSPFSAAFLLRENTADSSCEKTPRGNPRRPPSNNRLTHNDHFLFYKYEALHFLPDIKNMRLNSSSIRNKVQKSRESVRRASGHRRSGAAMTLSATRHTALSTFPNAVGFSKYRSGD